MDPASANSGPLVAQPAQGPAGTAQQNKKPKRKVLTSLALQIFIYFGAWWDVFYYIVNILVFVYKGLNLPYPENNFAMEFSFSWLWIFIEIPRLFLATMGNKTERAGPSWFSMLLGLPLIGMYVYFIAFQTYVLKIDQFLNGAALAFIGLQYLFGIIAAIRFFLATRFS